MSKSAKDLIKEIKSIGWSKIKLTRRVYRGGVQTYKTSTGSLVAVMFYIDEAFIVEDREGLFGVQDLDYGLIQQEDIDLEGTGHIEGLSLIAFLEGDKVSYADELLERIDINTEVVKEDIAKRLRLVNQLGEMVEVEL